MKHPVTMPILSDTITAGRLARWNLRPGDRVQKGDVLAEVETDKAILDVEAFQDGFLAGPLCEPDQDLPVRSVIGYIADSLEELETPVPSVSSGSVPEGLRQPDPLVSPPARVLAHAPGVDLSRMLPGSPETVQGREVLASFLQGPDVDLRWGPPHVLEPLRPMRTAVARNMEATLRTPSFQISAELPVFPLQNAARGARISLTLALARACALTVSEDPWFNHAWTRRGVARRERVDVGIAVDTGDGLVTPVLRDAASRGVPELSEDWRILLGKIRRGRLRPEDYSGATFYLSNLGVFPVVRRFDAIVPVGASAILAVAASQEDGRADFTLSCDHRVIFGADAARFLDRIAQRLRDPEWLQV